MRTVLLQSALFLFQIPHNVLCHPVDIFHGGKAGDPVLVIAAVANLKKTSLFDLAEKLGINPIDLTHYYIKQQGGCHD